MEHIATINGYGERREIISAEIIKAQKEQRETSARLRRIFAHSASFEPPLEKDYINLQRELQRCEDFYKLRIRQLRSACATLVKSRVAENFWKWIQENVATPNVRLPSAERLKKFFQQDFQHQQSNNVHAQIEKSMLSELFEIAANRQI